MEIGVGTGRIAVPLWDAGVTMTGVDLSEAMLAKLVAKTGGGLPFPIALADATQLPFKDQCFGSAIACHVLHLIPDWRRALVELVRAIRPGGVVLVDLGGWGADWRRIADRFCEIAGIPKNHRGANDVTEVDEAMLSLGAHPRALETVKATVHESLGELIDQLEAGTFSFTSELSDEQRKNAARQTRRWAAETFGPLEEVRGTELRISWRAYDIPRA